MVKARSTKAAVLITYTLHLMLKWKTNALGANPALRRKTSINRKIKGVARYFLRPTEGVLRLEPKESANHPLTRILFKNLKTKMKPNYI